MPGRSPFGMDGKVFGGPINPENTGSVLSVAEAAAVDGLEKWRISLTERAAAAVAQSAEVVPATTDQEDTELPAAEEPSGTAGLEVAEVDSRDGEEQVPFVNDNHNF